MNAYKVTYKRCSSSGEEVKTIKVYAENKRKAIEGFLRYPYECLHEIGTIYRVTAIDLLKEEEE